MKKTKKIPPFKINGKPASETFTVQGKRVYLERGDILEVNGKQTKAMLSGYYRLD